jgi:maltooligosyltrehalose trehalohydrolase
MISSYGRAKALLGITAVLASPYIPMLFMGEEYGETQPFWFFTDFNDASVISGVRNGRKREFSYQGYEPLDPQSEAAFLQSKLDWHKLTQPEHQQIFEYYQQLIRLKKHGVIGAISRDNLTIDAVGEVIIMRNLNSTVYLNFGANSQTFSVECKLLLSSDSNTLITQQQLTLNGFCAAIVQTELHRTKA